MSSGGMPPTYDYDEVGVMAQDAGLSFSKTSIAPSRMPAGETVNMITMEETASDSAGTDGANTDRLIIKTGRLSIVVNDVNGSVAKIHQYAQDKEGFVVSSDISKFGLAPTAVVTIRIPAKIFDEGVGELKSLGEVKSESVNGQDITEQYVDLEARMKNLKATETQFLEIMKKAVKIEDILNVQNQLMYVRENIERLEGQMKYLRESAAMSTLTINLSTDPNELPVVDEGDKWKPWSVVKNSARGLLEVGKGLANAIIWLVVYIPLWLVIILIGWFARKSWKKHREKKMGV